MTEMDDFGDRLIARRKALGGISQAEAARRAGATLRNWQRWEAGTSLPHLRQLPAIAAGLETTPAELLGGGNGGGQPRSAHELDVDQRLARIESMLSAMLDGTPTDTDLDEALRKADRARRAAPRQQGRRRAAG